MGENLTHGYDVSEGLYVNYGIHGLWMRGSDPMVGPIWSKLKRSNFLKMFFSSPIDFGEKFNAWL